MKSSPCLATLVAIWMSVGVSSAQRSRLAGTALDVDGEPCVGWTVRALGRTVPAAPEVGTLDRLDATTDDSGRFRLMVLTGVDYDVWAIGPALDDGSARVSRIAIGVGAGSLVDLRDEGLRAPLEVRVLGLEPWRDAGPFRVRIVPSGSVYSELELEAATDATFVIPPLPGDRVRVELLDGHGDMLLGSSFGLGAARKNAALNVPAPIEIPVVVTAAIDDSPVANATILHRTGVFWSDSAESTLSDSLSIARWRPCGTTDALGHATVRVAIGADPRRVAPHELVLRATATGFADSLSGWNQRVAFVDGQQLAGDAALQEVPFHLQAAEVWSAEIGVLGQTAPSGLAVLLQATCKIARDGGWVHLPLRVRATTDAAGRIHLASMPPDAYAFEVFFERTDSMISARDATQGRDAPLPAFLTDSWRGRSGPPHRFDTATIRSAALQVLDRDGGPARDARIVTAPVAEGADYAPDIRYSVRADSAGRVRLPVQPGANAIVIWHDRGFATLNVEIADSDLQQRITLEPYSELRVRVTRGGHPVAGANVDVTGTGMSFANGATAFDEFLDRVVMRHNTRAVEAISTGADGSAVLRFVPRAHVDYRLVLRHDGRTTEEFKLVPGTADAEPVPLALPDK